MQDCAGVRATIVRAGSGVFVKAAALAKPSVVGYCSVTDVRSVAIQLEAQQDCEESGSVQAFVPGGMQNALWSRIQNIVDTFMALMCEQAGRNEFKDTGLDKIRLEVLGGRGAGNNQRKFKVALSQEEPNQTKMYF